MLSFLKARLNYMGVHVRNGAGVDVLRRLAEAHERERESARARDRERKQARSLIYTTDKERHQERGESSRGS